MATTTKTPEIPSVEVLATWRGNARRHIRDSFAKDAELLRYFTARVDAIDISDRPRAYTALQELKTQSYVARNRIWLEQFLTQEFPKGRRTSPEEKALIAKARSTPLTTPNYSFVIQGFRNELHNIRNHDDRITDPETIMRWWTEDLTKRKWRGRVPTFKSE